MKKPDELKKLMEKIMSFKEVIIFPEGFEGKVLLDYLRYNRKFMWTPLYMQYVTCIAAESVFPPNNPNQFDHDLPVIPLENLVHFKDTALFVVATWPDRLEHVKKLFDDFDCKNIIYFSEKEYKQAQNALKLRIKNGDILSWKINNLTTELGKIKNLVTEQNEVAAYNTKAFAEYRNAFRGKKVVIVGGGPTVNYYNPIPDAIHIGLNFAWRRENISFDYLFTQDARINIGREIKVEEGFEKIRDKIFIGKYSYNDACHTYSENYPLMTEKVKRFCISERTKNQVICQDICYYSDD